MIVLAATPLGNPADASARLLRLLASADIVAAEDTRKVQRLARDLGVEIRGRVVAFHDHNEDRRSAGLLDAARSGRTVLVVSDAGTPTINDPGFRLVREAVEEGVPLSVAPGPSAVTAALAVSGLPTDRFSFEGFAPRKVGKRAAFLAQLAEERRTMVFFESPRRTAATLVAMAEAFGADRPAVLCRELTKTHEQILRGSLGDLAQSVDDDLRGEVTLVVAGATAGGDRWEPHELADEVDRLIEDGLDRRSAIAQVAGRRGVPRREVYDAVVKRDPVPDDA